MYNANEISSNINTGKKIAFLDKLAVSSSSCAVNIIVVDS